MSLSTHFEVKVTLYYRVHDAEIYGGTGSVGFAKQSFKLLPDARLENFDDTMAMSCRASMAEMLHVPPEKLDFMTEEEYERESEDEEDDDE
ncbi:MAG: hypothetical protein SO072_07525 [Dysosmobacter sp.]|nr:hypothetical protein [Dysosmobacter sp.]